MTTINGNHAPIPDTTPKTEESQQLPERQPYNPAAAIAAPRDLAPDPIDGSRAGWAYCWECQAIKPPSHVHGDPVEKLNRAELLEMVRAYVERGNLAPGHVELLEAAKKRR